MIKVGQVWNANIPGKNMFLKCFEEKDDKFIFMPVYSTTFNIIAWDTQERTQSKIWKVCSKTLVQVHKSEIDFFLERAKLEEENELAEASENTSTTDL